MHGPPPPRSWLALLALTMIFTPTLSAQHLGDARSVSIGASTAMSGDLSALDWNPAGLTALRYWEISTTSFYPLAGTERSLSLHMFGAGRRIGPEHAAAFRFSPGASLEFVVPTTFIFNDSSAFFVTQFDKTISYEERFSAGYAWMLDERTSVGASFHYIEERVTDTQYAIDTSSFIRASTVDHSGTIWTADVGVLWKPRSEWQLGLTGKNILRGLGSGLPSSESAYELEIPRVVRAGAAYSGINALTLAVDGDTKRLLHAGGEWTAAPFLGVRAGIYASADSEFSIDALAGGVGATYGNLRFDVSYLAFLSQANRQGSADLDAFQRSDLNGIEYNAFTSDRLTLTATVNFGSPRQRLAHIESVEMNGEIFPSSRRVYAFLPVGRARVRNISPRVIEAKVSFFLPHFMDAPTETQPTTIAPGATVEIPFYAVFDERVASNADLKAGDAEVVVRADPAEEYDDRYQARILVRGRNDWNGEVGLLKYFVIPNDADVLRFSRASIVPHKAILDTLPGMMQNFEKARIVFDEFARELQYVGDPKQSADFVQYPAETLQLRGGDCDDMSVCYASLLGSMGISTAFVDVVPPEHPEESHIFLMFDTGLDPTAAGRISDNPKRYVVRKNDRGASSVWIPIETTSMSGGFAEAWTKGAEAYIQSAEVQLGLVKGWVKVVDIEVSN